LSFIIQKVDIPSSSELYKTLDGSYFSDSYSFRSTKTERVALQIWLDQARKIPTWVNFLMGCRNKIVSMFGLKNLGHIGDLDTNKSISEYQVGDKVGIFTLLYLSDNEIILSDSDKHLDVSISVYTEIGKTHLISISTVVHVHNFLGKLYMLFVEPMHKLIVPSSIKRAERTDA